MSSRCEACDVILTDEDLQRVYNEEVRYWSVPFNYRAGSPPMALCNNCFFDPYQSVVPTWEEFEPTSPWLDDDLEEY